MLRLRIKIMSESSGGRKRKSGRKYWLFRTLRLVGVAYATVGLFACSVANRMIYMPPPASYGGGEGGFVRFGDDEQFAAFYLDAPDEKAPVLLWSHGNAEDAGSLIPLGESFRQKGVGLFLYDYPGYGLSRGKPNEKGCFEAADQAYAYLVNEKKIAPERIVLVGQSLGSGASSYLAAKKKAAGVVLISPFISTFRVVTRVKILPWDQFDNLKALKRSSLPLLVVHGDADEVVPFWHGRKLYEAYQGPKEFLTLEGVGHNDLWPASGDEVREAVSQFAKSQLSR